MLRAGIVGLPNVGMVTVPDARLEALRKVAKTNVVIPAAIEFVDIAGLVRGASQGEGLGNKFLTHIREVDAIVQVVRCFEDADIHHVSGSVDPVRDIEVINTELMLADLDTVQRRRERVQKDVKRGDKASVAEEAVLGKLEAALAAGKPALVADLTPEEHAIAATFFLLSDKKTIFACNVREEDLATAAGEKEVRAWTIRAGDLAPAAAGVIHSDFERGFIKAETVAYDDLVRCGSTAAARAAGVYRMEGKEYLVQDGDVMLFKFAV